MALDEDVRVDVPVDSAVLWLMKASDVVGADDDVEDEDSVSIVDDESVDIYSLQGKIHDNQFMFIHVPFWIRNFILSP